jgi:transketolase
MKEDFSHLSSIAKRIRRIIIEIIHRAGSGHPGGSLSGVEIGTALFFHLLVHNPEKAKDPLRDRFILSKGHAAPLLYALLQESGYFPEEWLSGFRKLDSPLQGHPHSLKCPGVEVSTGSLGQGLSIACGLAWGERDNQHKNHIYTLMGDGELDEGQVWEAAMFASHYHLHNLIAFIDRNNLQIDGKTETVMALEPLALKWQAFGWDVQEINGHSFSEIISSVKRAKKTPQPSVIIARTVKGKGVSFMENERDWHGKAPNAEEFELALRELE